MTIWKTDNKKYSVERTGKAKWGKAIWIRFGHFVIVLDGRELFWTY